MGVRHGMSTRDPAQRFRCCDRACVHLCGASGMVSGLSSGAALVFVSLACLLPSSWWPALLRGSLCCPCHSDLRRLPVQVLPCALPSSVCSDYLAGFPNTKHNDLQTWMLLYFIPSFVWLLMPFFGMRRLGGQILSALKLKQD